MTEKILKNNQAVVAGEIISDFEFSHEVFGEGFYFVKLRVLQQKCGCSGGQLRAVCLQLHLLAGDNVPSGMAAFTPGGCAGVRRGNTQDGFSRTFL